MDVDEALAVVGADLRPDDDAPGWVALALAAEVRRLRERRETAAQFVEAARRRGSIGPTAAEILLHDLRDPS